MNKNRFFLLGLCLVFLGSLVAWWAETSGGAIDKRDVRFAGTNGTIMSAYLYVPPGVTADNPAPGIVATHGYINSRETQAPFAIEFARRGYVVLAIDQTGHGYSDPPAFANGFGGPDGLAYMQTLDIVDQDNIALEGHSMGGWASVIAAATYPEAYESIVIAGSSTGTFGAPEGTPEFPRNFGLIFSTWDEFSTLMWGAETATDITETEKLQSAFGTDEEVEVGELYGSVDDGTARRLYQPVTTHPGDHLNSAAIADAIDWFDLTLEGSSDLDPMDQVWQWNEIGRLIALIGMVMAMTAFGGLMLETPYFSDLKQELPDAKPISGAFRYIGYLLVMFIPIVTYFWLQNLAADLIPSATPLFAQNVTNGIMVWAVGNGLISLVLFGIWYFTSNSDASLENYGLSISLGGLFKSAVLAIATVLFGYILLGAADLIFSVDFRFWVVAVKLMGGLHLRIFLGYLPFFLFFFLVLGAVLHGQYRLIQDDGSSVSMGRAMLANVGLLVVGFIVLLLVQYVPLLSGAALPLAEPLLTIVAFQFVPLLTIVGIVMTFFFHKTGTIYTGAFVSAIFITWVIVAAQATHFAF